MLLLHSDFASFKYAHSGFFMFLPQLWRALKSSVAIHKNSEPVLLVCECLIFRCGSTSYDKLGIIAAILVCFQLDNREVFAIEIRKFSVARVFLVLIDCLIVQSEPPFGKSSTQT